MGAAKYAPSNLADYVDAKVATAEDPFAEYLAEHPFMAQVVFSTQDQLTMQAKAYPLVGDMAVLLIHPADSIHGFADMFRFGAGTAETVETGSPEGVIKDTLRGVSIVALLWGAKNMGSARVRLAAGSREAALLCDVPGGACSPMSTAYALRKTGRAPRIGVADLVRANGGDPANMLDVQMGRSGVLRALDKLKIAYRTVTNPSSMAEVEAIARGQRGVTIFGVKFPNGGRHTMVAFIDEAGNFRIWDRTGKTVSSLAELEASYPGIAKAVPSGADPSRPLIIVDSLSVSQAALEAGILTMKVVPMLAVSREHSDPQMVAEGIESTVQRANGSVPEKLPEVPILGVHKPKRKFTAPRADWLTGVKYRLNHLGYGAGRVVHAYDDKCKRAIRAFQRDYRLKIDAIPGPKTQSCLVRVCGY